MNKTSFFTKVMSVLLLVSMLGLAGCPNSSGGNDNPTPTVVKTELNALIAEAEALNAATAVGSAAGQVDQTSKNAFTAAIVDAHMVSDDTSATQAAVDAAFNALGIAMATFTAAITPPDGVDYTDLNAAITAAQALYDTTDVGTAAGQVSQVDKDAFAAAIAAAQAVADDTEATQGAVNAAELALGSAQADFTAAIHADKTALDTAITAAETLNAAHAVGNAAGEVDQPSKDAFTAAIAAAQAVYDAASSSQAEVDAAVVTLADAVTTFTAAITPDGGVDYSALNAAILAAETLNTATAVGTAPGDVSQADKDEFVAAIAAAQAVADDVAATQGEVSTAVTTLAAAVATFEAAIIEAADTTVLDAAIVDAETLNAATAVGSSAGNVSQGAKDAFTAAIAAAQAVADDVAATQAEVDTAVTTLAAAVSTLEAAIIPEPVALIANGTFATDSLGYDDNATAGRWAWYAGNGGVATTSLASGQAVIDITNVGGAFWSVQFWQTKIAIPEAGTYRLSFDASADAARDMRIQFLGTEVAIDVGERDYNLTTSTQTFTTTLNFSGLAATPTMKLNLCLGNVSGASVATTVYLDNVSLVKLTAAEIPPVITLNGSATVNLFVGDSYTELGATVSDNLDAGLTVTVGGDTVNTATAGTYIVTYNVTDNDGNAADQKIRTVIVSEVPAGPEYFYSTAGTPDITATIGDGWGTGTIVTLNDTTNATYNPSIKLDSAANMWGGGPGVCVALTGVTPGFTTGFTSFNFKINPAGYSGMTTIKVKFPGATTEQITYNLSTGTVLADGWIQMSIPLSGHGTIPAGIVECAILEFVAGSGTVYITDICLVP